MRNVAQSVIWVGAALIVLGCNRPQPQQDQSTVLYSANHCDASASGWSPHGSEFGELMAHNTLAVGPGKLTWNGLALRADTLQQYLRLMSQLNPVVNIQVVFDDRANCRLVKQTRELVSDKLSCDLRGACVEYSEAEYQAEAPRHFVY